MSRRLVLAMLIGMPLALIVPLTPVAAAPRPDGCKRVVTSGRAFIGRDCEGGKDIVRVESDKPRRLAPPRTYRPSPVERLRDRVEAKAENHRPNDRRGQNDDYDSRK